MSPLGVRDDFNCFPSLEHQYSMDMPRNLVIIKGKGLEKLNELDINLDEHTSQPFKVFQNLANLTYQSLSIINLFFAITFACKENKG